MAPPEFENRVDGLFVENILTHEDIALSEDLARLAISVDLPYPLIQPIDVVSDQFLPLVQSRMEPMERYRALVTAFCKEHFPLDPDVALALEITRRVSGPLDRIFADQLNGGRERGDSWALQSPECSAQLQRTIEEILMTDKYADYFTLINRPLGDTLEYINDKLLQADGPQDFEEITKHLEALALQGYDRDQPVLLLTLSKYFTECPLEANVRFFLPFSDRQQKMTQHLVEVLWQEIRRVYRSLGYEPPDVEVPIFFGGTYLFGGGSELIYSTSAEKLNSSGLVFFPNVTKEKEEHNRLHKALGLPIPSIDNSMFILMIGHELGHLTHRVDDTSRVDALEVIPDLFSLLSGLAVVEKQTVMAKEHARRVLVLRALAEFRQQVRYNDPEYLVSSRYFLELLKSSGITDFSDDGKLQGIDISEQKLNVMREQIFFELAKLCEK